MIAVPSSSTNAEPIKRTKDDFLILSELGEGSYSTVYLTSERQTNRRFAIKMCIKNKILREKKVHQIFREKDILRQLSSPEHSSPFIVCLYCTFQDQDALYFVLTLAEKKDLLSRLKALQRFTVHQSQFVMAELCIALAHIHSLNVVHRDVKPENILLGKDGHILLSDFGCAKRMNEQKKDSTDEMIKNGEPKKLKRRSSFVGTAQYVSAEVLNGGEVTGACDWWAFGVILFELLAGKRPFCGESEYILYQRILALQYNFPDGFPSEDAKDLINQLLVLLPNQRIGSVERGGAAQIREHPFFAGVQWTEMQNQNSPLFPEKE